MTTRARKRTITETTPRTAKRRRTSKGTKRTAGGQGRFGNLFLPLVLSVCLVICLGVIGYMAMQTAAGSDFFKVRTVTVNGTQRAPQDDISNIAKAVAEKPGVLNADLGEIKSKAEKLPFVKTASVSRILPDGLVINIVEREPVAVVKLSKGNMLIDEEGNILAPAADKEESMPVTLLGWDEAKSEKAFRENLERVKLYRKMVAEWREFGLESRVLRVDLADIREPKAITEDSGLPVTIDVGREGFAKNLKNGIAAIVGKGELFDGVTLVGQNLRLSSRKSQEDSHAAENDR